MDWFLFPLIIAAGFLAGVINMYAGSGSLVSLAALVFAGVPPTVANGSNRIAVMLQNLVGARGYHQQGKLDPGYAVRAAVPAIVGSGIGAAISATLDEVAMQRAIGSVMVLMLVILLVKPKRWIEGKGGEINRAITVKDGIVLFLIGIYGGFIQAGVGIFLLASLVLSAGFDIIRANAVKVAIVFCQSVIALIVFSLNDQVNWQVGLVLAIGNMSGAWFATRFANRPGIAVWAHRLLVAVVIFSAVRLLFF